MREIEFRAIDRLTNEWRYGSLIRINNTYFIAEDNDMYIDGHHIRQESDRPLEVMENTIGQYTGYKDINGKKIFENDILQTNLSDRPFGTVIWHDKGYFFIDITFGHWNRFAEDYLSLGEMLGLKIEGKDMEYTVIGNMFDNP